MAGWKGNDAGTERRVEQQAKGVGGFSEVKAPFVRHQERACGRHKPRKPLSIRRNPGYTATDNPPCEFCGFIVVF